MSKCLSVQQGLGTDFAPGSGFDASIKCVLQIFICLPQPLTCTQRNFLLGRPDEHSRQQATRYTTSSAMLVLFRFVFNPVQIQRTFETVAKEGFPAKRIEALLHKYEVHLKHVRSQCEMLPCLLLTVD